MSEEPASGRSVRQIWDLVPVVVSLISSYVFIVRSSVYVVGRRAFILVDDAAISMTYARNLAEGHGLVWNAGQHPVEGYSNFLWTLWMAAIEANHPSDYMAGLWVMLSSAALLAANTYVVTRIAHRLAPHARALPIVAGLAAALYYALNSWSLVGMETGLVALTCSLGVLAALRSCDPLTGASSRRWLLVSGGVTFALGVLTRDDVIIVGAVAVGFVWLRSTDRLRSAVTFGLPIVIAEAGHIVFRIIYYVYPVPNTYFLKVSGIPETTKLHRGLIVLAQNVTLQLVLPMCLAVAYFVLVRRAGRPAATERPAGVDHHRREAVYVVAVGGDSCEFSYSDRILAPVVPLLFVLAVLGAWEVALVARRRRGPMLAIGVALVVASALTAAAWLPADWLQQPVVPLRACHPVDRGDRVHRRAADPRLVFRVDRLPFDVGTRCPDRRRRDHRHQCGSLRIVGSPELSVPRPRHVGGDERRPGQELDESRRDGGGRGGRETSPSSITESPSTSSDTPTISSQSLHPIRACRSCPATTNGTTRTASDACAPML